MDQSVTASNDHLRLLLALDSGFEPLAAVALCSFLRHNPIEQVVVAAPPGHPLPQLAAVAAAFETPLLQLTISEDAPSQQLAPEIRPYFYCIEALDMVCHGPMATTPGRYLYVDADTLCVRDLTELSRLPLSEAEPLAACSHGRPMPDRQLVLGLAGPYHYFNAGVLLFDSHQLARHLSSKTITRQYQDNQAVCRFREQCSLNSAMRNKIRYLPNQYNYLSWMRPRAQHLEWHQLSTNSMAYCLPDVRENLAIAHLSAGALPHRIKPENQDKIDKYWLLLENSISKNIQVEYLNTLPQYSDYEKD